MLVSRNPWVVLSLIVFLLGTFCALALVDEPLDPIARQMLNPPRTPARANNLFLGLHGFDAPPDSDPMQVGWSRVQAFEASLAHGQAEGKELGPARLVTGAEQRAATLPLCDFTVQYCLASSAAPLESILAQYQVPLQRYENLKALSELVTLGTPHFLKPVTRFGPLLLTQRLKLAQIVELGRRGDLIRMKRALQDEIMFNRRLLRLADTMLLKLVAHSLLLRTLHVYAQLSDLGPEVSPVLDGVSEIHQPLSRQELSLQAPLLYEFRLQSSIVQDKSLLADRAGTTLVAYLAPFVIKPNATLNLMWGRFLDPMKRFDRLNLRDFATRWSSDKSSQPSQDHTAGAWRLLLGWPINPVGRLLYNISTPQFDRYYARVRDLEGLRRLALVKNLIRRDAIADSNIKNYLELLPPELSDPYTGNPLQVDLQRRVLTTTQLHTQAQSPRSQAAQTHESIKANDHLPYQISLGPR